MIQVKENWDVLKTYWYLMVTMITLRVLTTYNISQFSQLIFLLLSMIMIFRDVLEIKEGKKRMKVKKK